MAYETMGRSRVNEDEIIHIVNTNDVKSYLQDRVDRICNAIRANGGENLNVKVTLTSEKYGKSYVPFLLALPPQVEDGESSNSNIPEALKPNDDDDEVRLKKPFYQLFANYCNDRKALATTMVTKNLGLYQGSRRAIQELMKPKKIKFGDTYYIVFILDPMRLFEDYLRDRNNPKESFRAEVISTQKINDDGIFEYNVKKRRRKPKDNLNGKEIHRRLARAIHKTKD